MTHKHLLNLGLVTALGLASTACAQPTPQRGASPANMPATSGMAGMHGQDHQAMMAQCADMRRQMAQGTHPNTPGMAQMMAHCDEMDRAGAGSTAAPAATRSR